MAKIVRTNKLPSSPPPPWSELNAVRQGCDNFPSLLVLFNTRKRFYRCKWNFKVHTSTSCFFHCVRRNRSHTSQRRLMISLSSVTRGWKLSFNLLINNYFYPPITGRSHSCIKSPSWIPRYKNMVSGFFHSHATPGHWLTVTVSRHGRCQIITREHWE